MATIKRNEIYITHNNVMMIKTSNLNLIAAIKRRSELYRPLGKEEKKTAFNYKPHIDKKLSTIGGLYNLHYLHEAIDILGEAEINFAYVRITSTKMYPMRIKCDDFEIIISPITEQDEQTDAVNLWEKEFFNAKRFFESKGNIKTRSRLKDKWNKEFQEMLGDKK